jgi:putative flippase GtrA
MWVGGSSRAESRARRGEWFTAVMAAITVRLPFGLARVIAPDMLGFAVIGTVTFSLNLVLLIFFHGTLGWPVAVSITLAYLAGSGLGYLLNRALNFRSHGAVAPQLGIFTVVATVNYFAWILGIGAGLTTVGVDYRLSRVIAGACESVYMYAAMRWLVFRDAWDGGPLALGGPRAEGDQRSRGGQADEAGRGFEHPAASAAPADCDPSSSS